MEYRLDNVQKTRCVADSPLDRAPLFCNVMYIIIVDRLDEININEDKVLLLPASFFSLGRVCYKSDFYLSLSMKSYLALN